MSEILSYGTAQERFFLYGGWIFSFLTGLVLPSFIFLMGPIFDAFGLEKTKDDSFRDVIYLVSIMGCLAGFIWIG